MSEQLITTPGVFGENGNFLLERELGRGGMGGVYLARDKMLDRQIAVKIMLPEYGADPAFVETFKREAQAAARLIHPNIAQIHSFGVSGGMPYIAMELVAGGSLATIMKAASGKTDITRILKLGEQVAQALRCAADQGLVHGDIKPDNILLDANGNAKIVDFGLAGMKNNTSEIWGTPYYIAPEKVKKEVVDFRADMYSLGGTLYHALTGVAPFEGEDAVAVVKKRFSGMPPKPSEIRPEISDAIDALVMKMLAFEKGDRFPSFEALLQEFARVMATGLTRSAAPAKPAAAPAGSLAKKGMAVRRGGKTMVMKKKGGVSGGMKLPSKASVAAARQLAADEGEEEEEEGSLGVKVIGVIAAVVLLVGGVIGGLMWYLHAQEVSRTADANAQIAKGITDAREAINATREAAVKFGDEVSALTEKVTGQCQGISDEIAKLLPAFASDLRPPLTEELVKAIQSTNRAEIAESTNVTAAVTNMAAAVTNMTAAAQTPALPTETGAEAGAEKGKPPVVVGDIRSLWERAYACEAAAIRIALALTNVVDECAKAETIKGTDHAAMEALGGLSRSALDLYDQVKASKDYETMQKAYGYIKSKGEKSVRSERDRLRIEAAQKEREAKRKAEEEEKAKRRAEEEEAHRAEVANEISRAKEKFGELAAGDTFKLLDFKGAIRQLEYLDGDFKTPEGKLQIKEEERKVNAMKAMLELFVANAKGYTFKKGSSKDGTKVNLKKFTITAVTDKELEVTREDGAVKRKITWIDFYKNYHGNLNELIVYFVENGRQNATPKLSLLRWAEAMCGAALTMRIICSDDSAAAERGEAIVKKVVQEFPDYAANAKSMFPELDLVVGESADE